MLSDAHLRLMPARDLRDELSRLAQDDRRIAELASRQPDDPKEPVVVFAQPEGDAGLYPMVEIPIPGRPGRLWVGRLPGRYGRLEEELSAIAAFGAKHVVCLLPAIDVADPQLYNVPSYVALARERFGDGFHLVEVVDYEVPADDAAFEARVAAIDGALAAGERVILHCGAGCGRTGIFAGCLMVAAGMDPLEAVRTYRRHRGCGPETPEQVAYVVRFARRREALQGGTGAAT